MVTVKAVEISTLLCVSIPVVSLLADMAVGKYKVVSHCLRAVWLLSTLSAIVSVCEKSLPLTNTTIHYTQLILVLPQYVLLGAFIATAVPLGIDQIHSASVSNISALIQWLLWTYFSGIALPGTMGS